jgi:sporadic carbohydrate cluster 2OG-Fe(II) oxygenase
MAVSSSNNVSAETNDRALGARFLESGFVIAPAEDRSALDHLRALTVGAAATALGLKPGENAGHFLDHIHQHVSPAKVNDLRLAVINSLLGEPTFRSSYFACARRLLESIVGNELAMQRNIGLSVQLPADDSSLLPLHSDTWGSECSPFEVVLWIPLVDCQRTKSMWLLSPEKDRYWRARVKEFQAHGIEALYKAAAADARWIDIEYGNVLLFTPTVMHGNRVNDEASTRWSFNVRFKGLFTPYANKKLGDFFAPIAIRPASRIGIDFEMPELGDG